MYKRSEGHFKGSGDANLYYQNWQTDNALATLVMTHGMAEHSEAYELLAAGVLPNKINLSVWDLRGHGKSDGKRGYVGNFTDYVHDLDFFFKHLRSQQRLNQPFFIGGHSLGGLIVLRYLLEYGPGQATGICLSSPLLGIAIPVPPVKDYASHLLHRFLPKVTLNNEIKFELLSRDEGVVKSYYSDPYRHNKISSGVYIGMLESMEIVKARAGNQIQLPTLMQVAGTDYIVSRKASEDFFQTISSENKELIVYEDAYHEIFNDLGREKVFEDLCKFILKTLGKAR